MLRAVEHGLQARADGADRDARRAALRDAPGAAARRGGAGRAADRLDARRRAARDVLGKLASGELSLVVGTHALIEDDVVFDRLAVAVVDEQHRFGVRQRARARRARRRAGLAPHVLHMTATPIPRTLRARSATATSTSPTLRELPRGPPADRDARRARPSASATRAYERIREELRAGRQAFVVCPLVEESEALQARAATRRVRAPARRRARGLPRRRCCTARCARARSRQAMARVRRRRRRRARRDDRDRGRHRRAQRDRDARRGRRALRHLASCTSCAGAIGRGEHASLCLLFGPTRVARGCRRSPQHRDGFRAGRDRPRAARRGRADRHAPVRPGAASASRGCPRTPTLLERARAARASAARADPELGEPEHALLARRAARRATARPSARADPGVTADAGRRRALRRPAPAGAAGRRHAPDVRPRARGAVRDARRRSTARACSTCSPAPARSASRRSRAARRSADVRRARRPRGGGRPAPTSRRSGSAPSRSRCAGRGAPCAPRTHARRGDDIRSGLPRPPVPRRAGGWDGSSPAAAPPCSRRRRAS